MLGIFKQKLVQLFLRQLRGNEAITFRLAAAGSFLLDVLFGVELIQA